MDNPLLIALDVESGTRAVQMADDLRGFAGGFKIGNRLFTLEGPRIVTALAERGDRVFLDLKFHDIPNIVAGAVDAATTLGVWMVNVHASGGLRMMQAARDAAREAAARTGRQLPLVIAVTVLTSMSDTALEQAGVTAPMLEHVARLARLTQEAGLDGVVASPRETALIRKECGANFLIVTPGIRGGSAAGPGKDGKDDQERTMSAREAVDAGASHIVVGRPIIAAPNPREAAHRIVDEFRR
jgi:orotidine-5'-phosphate decarboxylase